MDHAVHGASASVHDAPAVLPQAFTDTTAAARPQGGAPDRPASATYATAGAAAGDRTIGISPQFSVHVLDDRGLLLLSEQRSFKLNGKLYVALLPYLDGHHSVAEILHAFSGRVAEERLIEVLDGLVAKGYAGYLDPKAPAARQALWVELGLPPAEAERALARQRIGIKAIPRHGAPRRAATMLRHALADLGIVPVPEAKADLMVVCVDDQLDDALGRLDRRMRRQGRAWIPFKPGGAEARLGPVFTAGSKPCWMCLASALAENRPGDDLLPQGVTARPARAWSRASLMAATGQAALELARHLAGDRSQDLAHRLLGLDAAKREVVGHWLRPRPDCPACGKVSDPDAAMRAASAPLVLQPRPVVGEADGGWRVATAGEVVKRLEPYISPLTGLIAGLEDRSPGPGMPVITARQILPGAKAGPRENRLAGKPASAAGKGRSLDQARAGCLAEAVERYLAGFTGSQPVRRARFVDLDGAGLHPEALLNYSDAQYADREAKNVGVLPFNWIPERFDAERAIDWTPAWSLSRNRLRWLPTRFAYFRYSDPKPGTGPDNLFCLADSNGCASGSNLEEAVLQGFLELVERDACTIWWYNRLRRPAFDLSGLDDPFVRTVLARHDALGREVEVLDLTNDLGIPVAAAISARRADGGGIILGLGAHLDVGIAIARALSEANQVLGAEALDFSLATEEEGPLSDDPRGMDLVRWMKTKTLATETYCRARGRRDPGDYALSPIGDLKDAIEFCIRRLEKRGLEMIVLDLSRPEIDFSAARVVVPGMRHFWWRLGAGRLYDVPVERGWLPDATPEAELNPIGFFL